MCLLTDSGRNSKMPRGEGRSRKYSLKCIFRATAVPTLYWDDVELQTNGKAFEYF